VLKAIRKFECLNKFVLYVVSVPEYVKVVHLCLLAVDVVNIVWKCNVCKKMEDRYCYRRNFE